MQLIDDEIDRLLKQTYEQWNIAERRIKKAEQVRGNEVVASAIFELRYAGRKIADALTLALESELANDNEARESVRRYLADAYEDCVKAKHDAIDAMLDFVTVWFDEIEDSIGLEAIKSYFPDYLAKTARIADIQERIAESRENRHEGRDGIYDVIEQEHYDGILELFDQMRLSRDRVDAQVKRDRRNKMILFVAAILGPIIGLVAILVAIALAV